MKADAQTEAAVMAVLDKLAKSYTQRDWEGLRSTLAPDPDVLMYGTQADEKRIGLAEIKAQAERDWSQSQAGSIEYGWTMVSAAGDVAWAAADVDFKATVVHRLTGRGTMQGEFLGMPPTGKQATWQEIHIGRFEDGKIAEHWATVDQMGMLQQLGLLPAPGQG